MSRNRFRGAWHEIQGKLKAGWATAVKDELGHIFADIETVSGIIERSYDLSPEEARPHAEVFIWNALLTRWSKQLGSDWDEGQRRVAERWDKLPSADVASIDGRSEELLSAIERTYGIEDWQAASEMLSFFRDWSAESA